MIKLRRLFLICLIVLGTAFFAPTVVRAQGSSFVNIINPVRGADFWDLKDQQPIDGVQQELDLIKSKNLTATWLIRADALNDAAITRLLKSQQNQEIGLLLEITPTLTNAAGIKYHQSKSWHSAGSVFLTGYSLEDRKRLIDTAFNKFKDTFGNFPKSVGAWWIDADSLKYMSTHFSVTAALIVADQYSTDNYQIWGQFWEAPYYPYERNALFPARSTQEKIPVVIVQWAARDPFNGYGKAVEESTYSVQPNDYIDYHKLGTDYFGKLVDIYTRQPQNKVNQLVIGLENSYSWRKYGDEYKKQLELLVQKANSGQFSITTLVQFSDWYTKTFLGVSPTTTFLADDPLGSGKQVLWFMDPYYRAGLFVDKNGIGFRDIRQYVGGVEEPCLQKICDQIDFATFATRVLDEVTFGRRWTIDEGNAKNLKVEFRDDKTTVTYLNEANKKQQIELLPRDISINGDISSIDGAILKATTSTQTKKSLGQNILTPAFLTLLQIVELLKTVMIFFIFVIISLFIPGAVLLADRFSNSWSEYLFTRITVGVVSLTLFYYLINLLHLGVVLFVYPFLFIALFILKKHYKRLPALRLQPAVITAILLGSFFQWLVTLRSGLIFSFGMGFWGPNTHDGVWHLALINQLLAKVPPENPILSGEVLKNYHYFFDILVAASAKLSFISANDLLFRGYPLLFSLILGAGTISLISILVTRFKKRIELVSLFLVYTAGSFGWIVEYFKTRTFSGESDFWVNQSISYNLNPPFFVSLLVLIFIVHLLAALYKKIDVWLATLLCLCAASLVEFKAYAVVLVLMALGVTGLYDFWTKRKKTILVVSIIAGLLAVFMYLPNLSGDSFFEWHPFWFVHSMIDSQDRVGWYKLAAARDAYFQRGDWLKFSLVEALSLVLFIVGNLGVRVVGFLILLKLKLTHKNGVGLFISTLVLLSLTLPTFLIQKGNPWNTIQFFYYGLYFCAIAAAICLAYISKKLKLFAIPIIIILLIAPINSITTARGYLGKTSHAFLSKDELAGLEFLKSSSAGIVLSYPYDKALRDSINEPFPLFIYDTTAYVSALSAKSSYLADESQQEILQTDYLKRRLASKDFFEHSTPENKEFLSRENIHYIYLQKFYNIQLSEQMDDISKVFENNELIIYKVNK